mgnify:CR=1 FL=1
MRPRHVGLGANEQVVVDMLPIPNLLFFVSFLHDKYKEEKGTKQNSVAYDNNHTSQKPLAKNK